ncbi:pyridoxal-phosphate dependent enzyme [Myxococcota bacterium]|nr:pyridoxal-phosphate dependent enzyme [Myxococcota bacterium]
MRYHETILSAIGDTPLVKLRRIVPRDAATVLVKCEFMNPAGSIKDRMALAIIERAEKSGLLRPGGTIVENTSGNTGLGVAMAAAVKGYRCIFTMPDKMSSEKINMMKAFGAEVVVTPTNVPAESPESYYETAKRIARETPGSFYVNQYDNPDNIDAHYRSTGPEVWEQTEGQLDVFVAGIGTGGTMSGAGKYLKEKKPSVRNVAVDPIGSIYKGMFETGKVGTPHVYKVEGIGEDRVCKAMDFSVVDEVRQTDDRKSFYWARRLTREEGLFAGGSSGAAVGVAVELAKELGPGKLIVVILPDSGTRYVSKFFNDSWMKDNGLLDQPGDPFGNVGDMLSTPRKVISAVLGETGGEVAQRMRKSGISQMPVTDAAGRCVGMIHEIDVLTSLLEKRMQLSDRIDDIVQPLQGIVSKETPIRHLTPIFNEGNVAIVLEGEMPIAVITKIDVIEHLASGK